MVTVGFLPIVMAVAMQPISPTHKDEDDRVIIQSRPHWEPAYKESYTQYLRCRRGGRAEIGYRLDSRDKGYIFYRIESISLEDIKQPDSVVELLNNTLYSFDEMPFISLQCWRQQYRIIFRDKDDHTRDSEIVIPLK